MQGAPKQKNESNQPTNQPTNQTNKQTNKQSNNQTKKNTITKSHTDTDTDIDTSRQIHNIKSHITYKLISLDNPLKTPTGNVVIWLSFSCLRAKAGAAQTGNNQLVITTSTIADAPRGTQQANKQTRVPHSRRMHDRRPLVPPSSIAPPTTPIFPPTPLSVAGHRALQGALCSL
jgi:hypothetical protein